MKIPDLSRDDVLYALGELDRGAPHRFHESTKFDLVHEGRRYPPKAVVGIAAERINGHPYGPRDFTGGKESRCFLVLLNAKFVIAPKLETRRYAVITENDVSQWHDETGRRYHFPRKYRDILTPGTEVIYYKGVMKQRQFADARLTAAPHYFALARIGTVAPDPESSKGDLYAEIVDYAPFTEGLPARNGDAYLEEIPASKQRNYWRDGVRPLAEATYQRIIAAAQGTTTLVEYNDAYQGESISLESRVEGNPKQRYVTFYERQPKLRRAAIAVHGTRCCICRFDFGRVYGEVGEGYIHIHHVTPISTLDAPVAVDPVTDLVPVCANCHAIIHRRRDRTLSIDQMKHLIKVGDVRPIAAPGAL